MTGAVEFLRKAKAICESREQQCEGSGETGRCCLYPLCWNSMDFVDEVELVKKVMAYEIKEGNDGRSIKED